MTDRVAIVGTFQSKCERAKRKQHVTELVYETVSGLLAKLGMDMKQVDNIVSCSQDFLDGRTISNRTIPEVEGAFLKSETKMAGDGAQAVFYGMIRILSGKYKTCLVLAHAKMSEGAQNVIANAMFDPIYQRSLGLDEHIAAALQARAYMDKYGIKPEQTAQAAAKALTSAKKNELVFRGKKTNAQQVLKSKILTSPIHELEAFVPADGACALMLVAGDQAKKWTKNPVWVTGAGTIMDSYHLGDRALFESRALTKAAKKAYKLAGIKNPEKDLDLIELSNFYSYQELLYSEALGLCKPGEGAKLLESGATMADGNLPINPSGGVLGGNPLGVSGLLRVIEAANQIRGEAGKHQVKKSVRTALAQGSYGPDGQSQCAVVLSVK